MKLSIFTPTHDPRYLPDCLHSLLEWNADFTDWEWLIVPNGKATAATVQDVLPVADPRIRIVPSPADCSGIGALKKFACSQLLGDVFVELDHDDQLLPGALARIAKEADAHPDSFIYSDTIYQRPNGQCASWYGPGWEQYPVCIDGQHYMATRAYDPDPATLSEIWYSPDHVRVWTRKAYEKAGGHDPKIAVADDHDLICRTYIAGSDLIHVPEALYLYRYYHGANRSATDHPEWSQIPRQNNANYERHIVWLLLEWCRRKGLAALDLGGAHRRPQGFTPVDKVPVNGGYCWDVAQDGLKLPDNSVGVVRAVDFLEHIPLGRTVFVMNEIYRVLAPGGFLLSETPSTDGRGAFQDPTHVSFWNSNSFWYYLKGNAVRPFVPEVTAQFAKIRIANFYPSKEAETHKILYVRAHLCADKGQRLPYRC